MSHDSLPRGAEESRPLDTEESRPLDTEESPPRGPDETTSRTFWLGMTAGWGAYLAINVLLIVVYEEASAGETLLIGLSNVVPPALVSVVVALNRKRLLRPEWGLLRTIGVHVVVGLLFALASAGLVFLLLQGGGPLSEYAESGGPISYVELLVPSLFLYVIFFGFLMWSESIQRVQESHRLAAREAVLRAEAEARAIRAQFNPHFVFNTLHSLILLVRADPAAAERAIEDVATLIRYASIIQRRDLDAVALAKELEIARRYVALERLRLQDRLTVSWAVEVDPESVTIPAFALQTLVENAIKHGLEPQPEGGRIEVEVRAADGTLELAVRDDGVGADPREVEAATNRGLDLLRGRLEARYGGRGSLTWHTASGEGFLAVMRLPEEPPAAMPSLDVITGRGETTRPGVGAAVEPEGQGSISDSPVTRRA